MYEKITSYLNTFDGGASDEAIQKDMAAFAEDLEQSGFMTPNAWEAMGDLAWASRDALKEAAPSMSAETALTCLSAFIQQESDFPGIFILLVREDVVSHMLRRLKELDG